MAELFSDTSFIPYVPKVAREYGLQRGGMGPKRHEFDCAAMFLDISGFVYISKELDRFTRLGEIGTGEAVRKALNQYFGDVVSWIESFGGDVLKFAGDAIIVCFPTILHNTLEEATLRACECSLEIHQNLDMYDVGIPGKPLRCKVAISAGRMLGCHQGGFKDRWEFVPMGQPLLDMKQYGPLASPGDTLLSESALKLVDSLLKTTEETLPEEDVVVHKVQSVKDHRGEYTISHFAEIDDEVYNHFLKMYVPTAVARHHGKPNGLEDLWRGEIRTLAVMFLNITFQVEQIEGMADEAHEAFLRAQEIVARYEGDIRQVLYDDKGLMAIFFWGGPGKVHDDDPLRCVWTGLKVLSVLKEEGITAYVGITYGEAFCGNVGTYSRCEYSVTGPVVNLAARLMSHCAGGQEILCDENTASHASSKLSFENAGKLNIKGVHEPIQAFQPLYPREKLALPSDDKQDKTSVIYSPLWSSYMGVYRSIRNTMDESRDRSDFRQLSILGNPLSGKTTVLADAYREAKSEGYHSFMVFGINPSSRLLSTVENVLAELLGTSSLPQNEVKVTARSKMEALDKACSSPASFVKPPHALSGTVLRLFGQVRYVDLVDPVILPSCSPLTQGGDTEIDEQSQVNIIVEAICRSLVRHLASESLVALFFDACGDIKEHGWNLINQIASIRGLPVALVLSAQTEANVPPHHFQTMVTTLIPQECRSEVFMNYLRENEVRNVISEWLGMSLESIDDTVVEFILDRTDGIPTFIVDILKSLREADVLQCEHGDLRLDRLKLNQSCQLNFVPNSVASLVRARLDALSSDACFIAKVSSVLGLYFNVDELRQLVSDRFIEASLDSMLVELEKAGFIMRNSEHRWMFQASKYRYVAHALLPGNDRRSMHRAIANMLMKNLTSDEVKRLKHRWHFMARLGYHCFHAGDWTSASCHLENAATYAFQEGSYSDSLQQSHRAYQLLSSISSGDAHFTLLPDQCAMRIFSAESCYRGHPRNISRALSEVMEAKKLAERGFKRIISGKDGVRLSLYFAESTYLAAKYNVIRGHFKAALQIVLNFFQYPFLKDLIPPHVLWLEDIRASLLHCVEGPNRAKKVTTASKRRSTVYQTIPGGLEAFAFLMRGIQACGVVSDMEEYLSHAVKFAGLDLPIVRAARFGLALAKYLRGDFMSSEDNFFSLTQLSDSFESQLLLLLGLAGSNVRGPSSWQGRQPIARCETLMASRNLNLSDVDIGEQVFYAVKALVETRCMNWDTAVTACQRCVHVLKGVEASGVEYFAASAQVGDAVFHSHLRALIAGSCGWASSKVTSEMVADMFDILQFLSKRIYYCNYHLAMYSVVQDVHMGRMRRARWRLWKKLASPLFPEYLKMRTLFNFCFHLAELNLNSRNAYEREARRNLWHLLQRFGKDFATTYEIAAAGKLLAGHSLVDDGE